MYFWLLQVSAESEGVSLFLNWPLKIVHRIDDNSPLRDLASNTAALANSFEIIVIIEGVSQETSMMTQARTSYLPDEILWNYSFASLESKDSNEHVIDYTNFDTTVASLDSKCQGNCNCAYYG